MCLCFCIRARIHELTCSLRAPGDAARGGLVEETGRGLLLSEAMELLWTIYPPEATGLDTFKRSTWMKPVVDEREICTVAGDVLHVLG